MFQTNFTEYNILFFFLFDIYFNSPACIGQCTGCMCSCRCSCSGGVISDFEWEVI